MNKNVVLDFVGAHSTGKTTVMNGVAEKLKEQKRNFRIIESESRKVAKRSEDEHIYNLTAEGTQCLISLFNWGNILKSSMEMEITMCTDWAVRTLAYTLCSDKIGDRVINMHKQWLDLLHSDMIVSNIHLIHIYIPIEFSIEPDGVRIVDPEYQKDVNNSIKYILASCKLPYKVLTGDPAERVRKVMRFLDKINCDDFCRLL